VGVVSRELCHEQNTRTGPSRVITAPWIQWTALMGHSVEGVMKVYNYVKCKSWKYGIGM